MKKSLLPALPALALCLACGAGEPAIPEPALDREDSEVTQLVRDYLAAGLAGDTAASATMYVEEARNLENFERGLAEVSNAIKALGEPLALSYVNQIPGGSGITHVYRVEFADVAGTIFTEVDPGSGLLEGLFFEPLATGQSEDPRDRFEAHVFKQGSGVLPYRLLKPKAYDRNERYPLVLFLHGAGQRGDDNIQQIAQGITV